MLTEKGLTNNSSVPFCYSHIRQGTVLCLGLWQNKRCDSGSTMIQKPAKIMLISWDSLIFKRKCVFWGKNRLKIAQKTCCILLDTLVSGSPLIQNGKLIGAVTHVLVDNPTKGYAIFAENMLETAGQVADEKALKDAS